MTRSPGLMPRTSAPISATSPDHSRPGMAPGPPWLPCLWPAAMASSARLRPTARTRTSTRSAWAWAWARPGSPIPCRRRRRLSCALLPEEIVDGVDEGVEPVVMHPMAGLLEGDDAGRLEMPGAAVLLRVRRPALLAVDEERRAGDARPQRLDIGHGHVIRRPG